MLQFDILQVQFQEGKESPATAELYKVLKDHKNPFMQDLVSSSFKHCYQDEARKVVGHDGLCTQELDNCGTESVVRVTLVNPKFHTSLLSAVELLTAAKLQLDKFGFESSTTTSQASTSQLAMACDEDKMLSADKLAILVNDIAIAMGKLGCASYRGKAYKKNDQARYTYSYKCEARAFVNTLATNEFFKARLPREMKRVIDLLSDPFCELFSPLIINYDLIEVKDCRCWSINRRDFVDGAIEEQQVGKISPRAFCSFDFARDPCPKYFREVLENSLSPQEVAKFCDDFLKLLLYNKKQHKDKVPCLVGDANSGKTSLFMPILGLIHHGNVATVTKQKAFNKSMITPFTEVIFIDEATEHTLDIDDWKILTQGGYAAHDVKYQSARAFINRCPMLITSQRKLEFGPVDQPAMERRLRTYTFRSLPRPKKKASNWMRTHPMDCVLWAAQKAKEAENEDESEGDSEENTQEEESTFAEGVLREEEKAEIRSVSLPVLLAKEMPAVDTSDEGSSEDENDGDSGPSTSPQADRVAHLRDLLEKTQPGCLRHRHLAQMLRTEEHKKREEERSRAERRRQREDFLRSRGVSNANLSLLPDDLDDPTPSPIARDLERYDQARVAAQEQARREAAREAFQGTWLRSTEKDLQRCCERYQASDDSSERSTLKAYIKHLTGKLGGHHMSLGTFGTAEAVAERKRVCTLLGLLDQRQQHLVTSVAERLPLANRNGDGDGVEEEEGEEEEQSTFVTPVPSSSARQSHPSARSGRTTTTEASKRKRATVTVMVSKKKKEKKKSRVLL